MNKFKVGDLIIGNHLAIRHRMTKPGWKGKVISVDNDQFEALGIEGQLDKGPFRLLDDAFDLIDQRIPLTGMPTAHRNGRSAVVLDNGDEDRPFAVVVEGCRLTFDRFGYFYPGLESPVDLVQV